MKKLTVGLSRYGQTTGERETVTCPLMIKGPSRCLTYGLKRKTNGPPSSSMKAVCPALGPRRSHGSMRPAHRKTCRSGVGGSSSTTPSTLLGVTSFVSCLSHGLHGHLRLHERHLVRRALGSTAATFPRSSSSGHGTTVYNRITKMPARQLRQTLRTTFPPSIPPPHNAPCLIARPLKMMTFWPHKVAPRARRLLRISAQTNRS
jgi:hypothetical protein